MLTNAQKRRLPRWAARLLARLYAARASESANAHIYLDSIYREMGNNFERLCLAYTKMREKP